MKQKPLRTALIGFGKVAAGYADDALMSQYYPYATHAQVLRAHPDFEWVAAVDPSQKAREYAQTRWQVPAVFSSVKELAAIEPEVVVLATPPQERRSLLELLPSVRGVFVEKPLALDLVEAINFIDYCEKKSLSVQVNFWRRGDELFRQLAHQLLSELIGEPQAMFGVYGNGLLNNGSHQIDFLRFLCGEVRSVQAISHSFSEGPLVGDKNLAFNLIYPTKIANFQPIKFTNYRECSLDLWGERGRIALMQEGLKILHYPCLPNRSTQGCHEIASDQARELISTVGNAFYHMYTNLAEAINQHTALWSPARSALRTMQIITAIQESAATQGKIIHLPELTAALA